MHERGESLRNPETTIQVEDRVLLDFDNLLANRLGPRRYEAQFLSDIDGNYKTAVQEGGIPHAVSTTEHSYEKISDKQAVLRWLGKTAVENAESGYKFHEDVGALQRVDVEVDEAHYAQENLRPDIMKIFISPEMSEKDASQKIAKREHLHGDDAVRASYLVTDEHGEIQKMKLQSLLVRDVPLQAWVNMLADPNNIFGKAIVVEDPESALSVMKVHRELEVPLGVLTNGPVDVVRAVMPYIKDSDTRQKVEAQIKKYESDQELLDAEALRVGKEWRKFDMELVESYLAREANSKIKSFIYSLQQRWTNEHRRILKEHEYGEGYRMTRKLARMLAAAKQNILWAKAGVATGNEDVLNQMDDQVVQQIRANENKLRQGNLTTAEVHYIHAQNNSLIDGQKVSTGGGCPGTNNAFGSDSSKQGLSGEAFGLSGLDSLEDDEDWKLGVCRIEACDTRPGVTMVGPCSICKSCEAQFRQGNDPTKNSPDPYKKELPQISNQTREDFFAEMGSYLSDVSKEDKLVAVA